MNVLEQVAKVENITGDLHKLMTGQEVELPEGFEKVEDYTKKLIDDWQTERKQVAIQKYVKPEVDKQVKEKMDQAYPATVNPIRNKMVTLAQLDKELMKDKDPKEILDVIFQKHEEELKKVKEDKDLTDDEKTKKINSLQNDLVLAKQANDALVDKYKVELEKEVAKERKISHDYIYDSKLGEIVGEILPKLSVGSMDGALSLVNNSLRKHGYKLELEFDSNNKPKLKGKDSAGGDAMDLQKNKFVSIKDLILELAAEDKYLKMKNTTTEGVIATSTKAVGNGKTVDIVLPDYLK